MQLTQEEKYRILLAIMTLYTSVSETRDISNIISDAVRNLHRQGDQTITEGKALAFWQFLKKETKQLYPNWQPEPWGKYR